MSTDTLGFTPTATGQTPAATSAPVMKDDGLGFQASGDPATPPAPTPPSTNPMLSLGVGALNFINNNPVSHAITSLAALPVQGVAKVFGQPDPYANGIGTGGAAPKVTSSDQPLGKFAEEEAGNAGTVGSLLLPAGKAAEAVAPWLAPVLGRFAPAAARIGTQAAIGGFQGLAGGMQAGQDASQLPESAKLGAVIGGGLATAGELGAALVDHFANNTGEARMAAQTNNLKTLQRAYNEASTATTNPIKTMEENALTPDLRVIDGKVSVERLTNPHGTGSLDNLIQSQQDMGTQAVESMQGSVPTEDLKKAVVDSVKNNPLLKAKGNIGKITAEVGRRFDDYAESYGDSIPYKDVNNIRIAMNKTWDPETWDAEKAIGNAARGVLYNGTGAGTTLKSAMQNEQELINAKEFIQKMAGTAVRGGRLGKYIADLGAGIAGSVAGAPFGPLGSGVGAMASGAAADKLMGMYQRNYFSPMLSGPARAIQTAASTPAVGAAARIGKSILIPSAVQ